MTRRRLTIGLHDGGSIVTASPSSGSAYPGPESRCKRKALRLTGGPEAEDKSSTAVVRG